MSERPSIEQRAHDWIINGEVGISSKTIWAHMMGVQQTGTWAGGHPHDPADLRRCILLLERVPEWRGRMPEMAAVSPEWARLSAAWPALTEALVQEAGWPPKWGSRAPDTYEKMRKTIYDGEQPA